MSRRRYSASSRKIALNTVAVVVALVTLFPIFWMVSTAFKPATEIYTLSLHDALPISAISEDAATEPSVTTRLLRRNVQYGMPITLPLSTFWKFTQVGWDGSGCGVSV